MSREERRKLKVLNQLLPKILKEKIKIYPFKKKDYMIYYNKKDLFFDLLMHIKVIDGHCYCVATAKMKPLWLDDLLWFFLQMEDNQKQPMSLRAVGAFTVSGSEIFIECYELKNWNQEELEKCIDMSLEQFNQMTQKATIDDFISHINTSSYHQELRQVLTLVYKQKYQEALQYLRHERKGDFQNGNIDINDAIKEYCQNQMMT